MSRPADSSDPIEALRQRCRDGYLILPSDVIPLLDLLDKRAESDPVMPLFDIDRRMSLIAKLIHAFYENAEEHEGTAPAEVDAATAARISAEHYAMLLRHEADVAMHEDDWRHPSVTSYAHHDVLNFAAKLLEDHSRE